MLGIHRNLTVKPQEKHEPRGLTAGSSEQGSVAFKFQWHSRLPLALVPSAMISLAGPRQSEGVSQCSELRIRNSGVILHPNTYSEGI